MSDNSDSNEYGDGWGMGVAWLLMLGGLALVAAAILLGGPL